MVNGGSRRYEIVLIGVLFFTWGHRRAPDLEAGEGSRHAARSASATVRVLRTTLHPALSQYLAVLPRLDRLYDLAVLMNAFAPLYMTEVARQPPRRPGSFWARVE